MKTAGLVAAAALAAVPVVMPAAARGDTSQSDSYTLSTDAAAALPGATVHVTATDTDTNASDCAYAPYTLALDYIAAGGSDTTTHVASGTTDAADGHVDTTFTMPADAASSDAAGKPASLTLDVTCAASQSQSPAAASAVQHPNAAAATPASTTVTLTVSSFSGRMKVTPRLVAPGGHLEVLLSNCQGGPDSSTFTSSRAVATAVTLNDYNASTLQASGTVQLPADTAFGVGSVTAQCWQTSYDPVTVNIAEVSAVSASSGSAPPAHPVTALPQFTG